MNIYFYSVLPAALACMKKCFGWYILKTHWRLFWNFWKFSPIEKIIYSLLVAMMFCGKKSYISFDSNIMFRCTCSHNTCCTFFRKTIQFRIMRSKFALDKRTILCLYVLGIDRQILKYVKFCRSDQSKWKNKKKQKSASLLQNPHTIHKIHNLAS